MAVQRRTGHASSRPLPPWHHHAVHSLFYPVDRPRRHRALVCGWDRCQRGRAATKLWCWALAVTSGGPPRKPAALAKPQARLSQQFWLGAAEPEELANLEERARRRACTSDAAATAAYPGLTPWNIGMLFSDDPSGNWLEFKHYATERRSVAPAISSWWVKKTDSVTATD